MYQPQTQFPQVTNRESWTQLFQISDDQTGDQISLTNTGGQGTYASWAVQVSDALYGEPVITSLSTSSLTIGNGQFSAVIDTNLAIVAGQYVDFLYQLDNTQFMQGQVTSYDPVTGIIVFAIVAVSIDLEIRRVNDGRFGGYSGYGPNYAAGSFDHHGVILRASVGNGISFVDTGVFQVYFSETQFRCLGNGMHDVSARITSADGVDVRTLLLGRLPVVAIGGVC